MCIPWKTDAFSQNIEGAIMVDFEVIDERGKQMIFLSTAVSLDQVFIY